MTRDGCPVGRLGAAGLLVLLAAAPPGHGGRGASVALAESVVVNLGHAGDQYTVGVQLEATNASSGEPPLIDARRVLFHTGRTELALVPNSTLDSSAQACAASREEDCSISDVEDAYYTNFTCGRLACRTFDGTVVLNSRGDDDPTTAAEVLLVKSVGTEMPQLHRWRGVDGALGAAFGNRRSAFQGFLANATADGRRLYALDLFPDDARRSTLRLGGVDPSYEPTLRWGQPQARDELFLVSSFLHDLEICGGINVLGNWSDTWEAVIDTAASCLTLPEQFYDVVTAWLPLTCEDADGRPIRDRKGIQRWCVATSSAPLPALSFRMRPDGSRVYVSLSDLVLDSADVLAEEQRSIGLPVCILKGASLLDGADNYDYTDIPRIVLGTLALRSLYTVVDMDAATVGFANKLSASEINALQDTSLCRPAEECKPTQARTPGAPSPFHPCLPAPPGGLPARHCRCSWTTRTSAETRAATSTFSCSPPPVATRACSAGAPWRPASPSSCSSWSRR